MSKPLIERIRYLHFIPRLAFDCMGVSPAKSNSLRHIQALVVVELRSITLCIVNFIALPYFSVFRS